jgi:hypothetical protein
MDVFDRPLFQNRAARDRLKDMGNVQGFAPGGEVIQRFVPGDPVSFDLTGAIRRPVRSEVSSVGPRPSARPSGLPSLTEAFQTGIPMSPGMIFDNLVVRAGSTIDDPGTVMQALNEKLTDPNLRPNERRALENQRDALNFAIEAGYGATDAVTDALSVLQSVGSGVMEYGVAPVVSAASPELGEMIYDQIPMFDATAEELARMGQAVPSNLRPSDIPKKVAFEAAGRGTPPSAPSVGLPEPRTGLITPEDRQGPMAYTSPAELAAEKPAGPRTGPGTPGDRQAPLANAGLISDPTAVAAGLNAEDPEVRDKTIADFMQEFTSAAPKYEGVDKGLLLAQIGFAIAAGESPNAMQNIANGLLAGSDMLLKDKAAKSEFDRQLQLSAMQYGLQEVGKQRTRAEQTLNFVALEDTVYKGRKIKAGDSVYIPYGDIEKNGGVVPSGFGDSSMVTAITDRAKAVSEALEKARQEELLDDTFAESQREKFSRAASTAISAERGLGYMEAAIIKVGEKGNITGLAGTADDLVSKVAAAAGLNDVNEQFNSREEVQGLVKKAFQNLIPAALSGVQTANSISNRDIEILADAYVNSMLKDGVFSMATITEDKLLDSMKGAVALLESERQQSLVDMGTIEKTLVGRTLRSGAEGTSLIEPYRDLIPGQGGVSQPLRLGSLVYGEDGIYEIVRPGN